MSRLRRGARLAAPEPTDQVPDLSARLQECRRLVNRNAGQLPVRSVVAAHEVVDVLCAALGSDETRELDVRTLVGIERFVDDYLPTAIRNYLAQGDDRTADDELQDQLEILLGAAEEQLAALRERDRDAMSVHRRFLETKFSRSDLDIT